MLFLLTFGENDPINWLDLWAFADIKSALPVLERAAYPLAVYPDFMLVNHARKHGKEIIEH